LTTTSDAASNSFSDKSSVTPDGPEAELHFLGWSGPALPAAADLLTSTYAGDAAVDLSSVLVALPGSRAGRRLLELLLERAEAAGLPLRPPRIATVGSLPEILAPQERPTPSPIVARRRCAEALKSVPSRSIRLLVDPPPEVDDLAGWMNLAAMVETLEAQVGAGGHDFASVAEECRGGFLFDDRERWSVLARVQRQVEQELDSMGQVGRESHRRRVVDGTHRPGPGFRGDVWLVAVPEMPFILRAMLGVVSERIRLRAMVHAPTSLAGAFDALGCVRPDVWARMPAEIPDGVIRVVGGPRDQADELVRVLRGVRWDEIGAEGQGGSAEDVTVGVPDPDVVPFLEDRLAVEGVPSRRADGRPLERTPPFRLLEALAEHLAEGTWMSFAALIRHPDVKGLVEEEQASGLRRGTPPTVVADRYHAEHLPRRLEAGRLPHGERERGQAVMMERIRDRLRAHLVAPLETERALSRWGGLLVELLIRVYGDRDLDPHRPGDRAVLELAEGIREVADGLAMLPGHLDTRVDGAQALRVTLDLLRGTAVPASAETEAVELLGWLELHLDDAAVLVVTGVNEPFLPESVTGDPFLPHALRSRLGLLDNAGRWARDLYRLRAMLASRPDLVLISARRTMSGDPLRPSRLLLAEEGDRVARRLRNFLRREEQEERPELGAWEERPERERVAKRGDERDGPPGESDDEDPFSLPPDKEIRAPAPPDRLAVTAFRTLLQDPYRFALERVLGLQAVDDQARELDPMGFGVLAHRVLELFGRDEVVSSGDPDRVKRLLDTLLDREVGRRFGRSPHPAVRIQVEQLRARLRAFGDWHAGWTRDGWRTMAVEVNPPGEGQLFQVDGQPFYLRGRIDRVDHHAESDRWILFDYKTSARGRTPEETHRKKDGRKKDDPMVWVDLQLPLYRHLVRGVRGSDGGPLLPPEALDRVEVGFILLPDDLDGIGESVATEWTRMDLLKADEVARELVRELRRNHFTWDRDTTSIRPGDSLARVVGLGAYRDLEEDDEGEDEDE
jgi:ATP-dependent helicase/nuclease subunit B